MKGTKTKITLIAIGFLRELRVPVKYFVRKIHDKDARLKK